MSLVIPERRGASNPYLERIKLVQGSIETQGVDAIVTLLPQDLEYRGALNKAIQAAAGEALDEFIQDNIFSPRPGDIYAVPGFNLPCKHILFAVVPVWKDDFDRHDRQLLNACRKAMEEARAMSLKTIAFPPLGSGGRGFPKERAARLMMQGISDRLDRSFEEVRIVARTQETLDIFEDRLDLMSLNL